MAKKIMERSLALGALMAFVITGSAMAADLTKDTTISTGIVYYDGYNIGNKDVNLKSYTLTVDGDSAKYSNAIKATNYSFIGDENSSLVIKAAEGKTVTMGLGCYGTIDVGDLRIESNSTAIQAEIGLTKINATNVTLNSKGGYGVFAGEGGSVEINTNSLNVTSGGYAIGSAAKSINIVTNDLNISGNGGYAIVAMAPNANIDIKATGLSVINGGIYSDGGCSVKLNIAGENSYFKGYAITGTNSATNLILNKATWYNWYDSTVSNLMVTNANIKHSATGDLKVKNISGTANIEFTENAGKFYIDNGEASLKLTMEGKTADDLNTSEQLTTVASKLGVSETAKNNLTAKVVIAPGTVTGEKSGDVVFEEKTGEYYYGKVNEIAVEEKPNETNASITDVYTVGLMAWRSENNDMNKRLGELRGANGEYGAWIRMTRGESEYKSVKNQYNAYQMGYDQKVRDWSVGAAVTYTEAETSIANGSGENNHTGFAIYGSKLNNDGSYIDLIAKYAKLDHEYTTNAGIGSGDYDTDCYAFSVEYGKRLAQCNGLWIEPQVELTYGKVDNVDFVADNGIVSLSDMDSLVGRLGFRAGKDIKDGNIYLRASYLYDFEGKVDSTFSDGIDTRKFEYDLGGGWWEVGVGANINLSKATYVYADVEKTFGGEVDTNWQWNLGVRYSF